jgi:hypothetical protein
VGEKLCGCRQAGQLQPELLDAVSANVKEGGKGVVESFGIAGDPIWITRGESETQAACRRTGS